MDARTAIDRYLTVRGATEALAAPLSAEDQMLQAMPACSPTKWHRAHTTWFFETFVLQPRGIAPVDASYGYLFNSYYDAIGPRQPQPQRGLLSRPSCSEIGRYRAQVDERMVAVLQQDASAVWPIVALGLAHEEQHQELLLTDILHAFSLHPHGSVYRSEAHGNNGTEVHPTAGWIAHPGGVVEIGVDGRDGFAFDHEGPRHRQYAAPFEIADQLVTVRQFKAFANSGAYDTPTLWQSAGWAHVHSEGWRAPLHARWQDGSLWLFGLSGWREALDDEPVAHLSWYEAEALALFLGARLPTEIEWELVAREQTWARQHAALRPLPGRGQWAGEVWQWTRSTYGPYPGFRTAAGALGEYNGKFMVNQFVLRGGSCFTPVGHARPTYRNFWDPATRFQMTGLRLARDV